MSRSGSLRGSKLWKGVRGRCKDLLKNFFSIFFKKKCLMIQGKRCQGQLALVWHLTDVEKKLAQP